MAMGFQGCVSLQPCGYSPLLQGKGKSWLLNHPAVEDKAIPRIAFYLACEVFGDLGLFETNI